jgi:hypothetical protein
VLARNSYEKAYVDGCRATIDRQLAAYDTLASGAKEAAVADFEPLFCGNLVLVLDQMFQHRTRGLEGKDGNPLNEVRLLAASWTENDGVLVKDKQIKQGADLGVLGLEPGDQISITREQLGRLAEAYFAEVEVRFPPS